MIKRYGWLILPVVLMTGCFSFKQPVTPVYCAPPPRIAILPMPQEPARSVKAGDDVNIVLAKSAATIVNLETTLKEQQKLIIKAQGK